MKNSWIFQSVVDRYDLRDDEVVRAGKRDTWYATRYLKKMQSGDLVYFWLGGLGEERGIYAFGHLDSEPYQKDSWDSAGIDVVYESRVTPPLVVNELKQNETLKNLLILRAAQATNFLLSSEEAAAILELSIGRRGE